MIFGPEYVKDKWPGRSYKSATGLGTRLRDRLGHVQQRRGCHMVHAGRHHGDDQEARVGANCSRPGLAFRRVRPVGDSLLEDLPRSLDMQNFVIYSDDHGKTWRLSDNEVGPGVDESQVVELADGSLLLNMRSTTVSGCRVGATSTDGGKTWSEMFEIPELPDPVLPRQHPPLHLARPQGGKSRILFCNPASKTGPPHRHGSPQLRRGKTWPVGKVINTRYLRLLLPDGFAGWPNRLSVLYHGGWTRIKFASLSLEWLTDGKDTWKRGT